MEKSILIVGLAVLLAACTKKSQENLMPNSEAAKNGSAQHWSEDVTVRNGRLHFTVEAFGKAIEADRKEEKILLERIAKLEGFTSQKEIKTSLQPKIPNTCNCPTDDEIVNEIVDEAFMLEVGNFTVKFDMCQEKFLSVYRPAYSATNLEAELNSLRICDYSNHNTTYDWTFEDELFDRIAIATYDLEGVLNPYVTALFGCNETACSDREDVSWEYDYNFSAHGAPTTFPVGRFYLRYHRGTIKGTTTLWMEDTGQWPNWVWRFEESQYEERCGDLHTRSLGGVQPNILDFQFIVEGPRLYVVWEEYYGKRLKAGFGSVAVKATTNPYGTFEVATDEVLIVF